MSEPTIWAKAKAEIQRRGWWKGGYCPVPADPDDCPVCILGALNVVICGRPDPNGPDLRNEDRTRAKWTLAGHLGIEPFESSIGDGWNDRPDRTIEDVYRVLDDLDAAERQAVTP